MRRLAFAFALLVALPAAAVAQHPADRPPQGISDRIFYRTPLGAMRAGYLYLPPGAGPFPGVVIYSIAGVNDLIDRMADAGFAVLLAERRGMGTPDQYLDASMDDLVNDALGALGYLRALPEVDPKMVGVIAQGGETLSGIPAFVREPVPAFVVLLSPTGLRGDEDFRLEQTLLAQGRGKTPAQVAMVNDYVLKLADIINAEPTPAVRTMKIQGLMDASEVRLDQIASFPSDEEEQVRFFASPWWRDYFAYRPDVVIAELSSPTLVLYGTDDTLMPPEIQLPAVRGFLAKAPTRDATVCLLPAYVHHLIEPVVLDVIGTWIGERVSREKGLHMIAPSGGAAPTQCIGQVAP